VSALFAPLRAPLALCLVLLLTGCAGDVARTAPGAEVATESTAPIKAAIDDRQYRYFTLANGLRVLVVSDPSADQAAAALAVDAGSFAEPAERPGLAHFLEHMLFLGTEKYPAPDEYADFIARNGGNRNAYTALDHTNYFFSISADQLYEGLDRFAQFFVAPLFTAEYVDREKNAVNSEYQLQLRDDGWRTYMTQKNALNPAHPGSRFTIGSLDTLADRDGSSVRDELLAFYRTHYSADRMSLVIIGREDNSTLATWAEALFAAVPRRETAPAEPDVPMFAPGDLPQLMRIRPVKETRVMELTFPVPPLDDVYRVDPTGYFTNLIGHEGEGSLHALLRERGWIESLSAGSARFGEHNASVDIRMELTEAGLEHWREAGAAVFAYVDLVRRDGIDRWRYEEDSRLAQLSFDYQEKRDPFAYASRLASNMLEYPAMDVIRGPSAMDRFDATLIRRYLDRIRPDNVGVTLIAPDLATDRVEPWFDVAYAVEPLPADITRSWVEAAPIAALRLPTANPFIPEDLELVAASGALPQPLREDPPLEVWYLADPAFGAPRAQLRIDLRSDLVAGSAEDRVLATLYARLVDDALNAFAYPARLAGLSFAIAPTDDALTLNLGGFDDKLDVLLDRLLEAMTELEIRPERFALFQQELVRTLRNSREDRPYQQTMAELQRLLESSQFSLDAMITAAQGVDQADLEAWIPRFLATAQARALFHGNLDRARADRLAATLREDLDLRRAVTVSDPTLVRLSGTGPIRRQVVAASDDAALSLYVQGRDQSWAERARYGLLAHMVSSPYFNDLRTERQFGYVVSAGAWVRMNTPGIYFVVQSPVVPPAVIEAATDEFLAGFEERLAGMGDTEFENERAGLLSLILEQDKNLAERSGRLWRDLDDRITTFDSRARIAAALKEISLEDFRDFYASFIERARSHRAATWSAGRFPLPDAAPSGMEILDPAAFKAAQTQFTAAGAARSNGVAAGGR
jgi:secreted Zn-dependent insulinase-like peptidase